MPEIRFRFSSDISEIYIRFEIILEMCMRYACDKSEIFMRFV